MFVDFRQLRHILAVAENASFSRAADAEGITQSALSRSIASFEERHGITVFQRDRGRGWISITPAGAFAIEEARRVLASVEIFHHNMNHQTNEDSGNITFGIGALIASMLLPQLSKSLINEFPRLRITSIIRQSEELISELLNGRIDAIFATNWNLGRIPGTIIERLGHVDVSFIVRWGHPLKQKRIVKRKDIEQFPIASTVRLPTGKIDGREGFIICDNCNILRDVVISTNCVWITSPYILRYDLMKNHVSQLSVPDININPNEIVMVVRRGVAKSKALMHFQQEMVNLLKTVQAGLGIGMRQCLADG